MSTIDDECYHDETYDYYDDDNNFADQSGKIEIEAEDWESEIVAEPPRASFSIKSGFTSSEDELQDDYHSLQLSEKDIIFVDTVDELEKSMNTLFEVSIEIFSL